MKKYVPLVPAFAAFIIIIDPVYQYFANGTELVESDAFQASLLLMIIAMLAHIIFKIDILQSKQKADRD